MILNGEDFDTKKGKYLVNGKYYRENQLQIINGTVYKYTGSKKKVVEEKRKRGIPTREKALAEISDFNEAGRLL